MDGRWRKRSRARFKILRHPRRRPTRSDRVRSKRPPLRVRVPRCRRGLGVAGDGHVVLPYVVRVDLFKLDSDPPKVQVDPAVRSFSTRSLTATKTLDAFRGPRSTPISARQGALAVRRAAPAAGRNRFTSSGPSLVNLDLEVAESQEGLGKRLAQGTLLPRDRHCQRDRRRREEQSEVPLRLKSAHRRRPSGCSRTTR